jgi:hypothetical protein
MPADMHDVLLRFRPRELAPGERALFSEWLSLAGDVASAYVSGRKSDDPALYRRIVVVAGPDDQPTHLIHAPAGQHMWLKMTLGPEPRTEMFETLHAALNSIQHVLK